MKKSVAILLVLSLALLMSGCTDKQVKSALVDMGYAPAEPGQTVTPSPALSPDPSPTITPTATPEPTPSPTVTPNPDNVSGVDEMIELDDYPKSIKLNKKKLTLARGQSRKLKATLKPKKAKIKSVVWTSSDESIVTVSQKGKVTAVAAGEAVITCETANGLKAECAVKVTEKKVKAVELRYS